MNATAQLIPPRRLTARLTAVALGQTDLPWGEVLACRAQYARLGYDVPPLPERANHVASTHRAAALRERAGTALAALISNLLSIKSGQGCGCQALADQMDRWGLSGCETNRAVIVQHLCDNREMLIEALSQAGWLHVAIGWVARHLLPDAMLRLGAGMLLDRAMETVRSQPKPTPRPRTPAQSNPQQRLTTRPKHDLRKEIIRVGLASHGVYEGGVEEWFRCLATGNTDPTIQYTAIGVFDRNMGTNHKDLGIPVVSHDRLQDHCDLILGWATDLSHLRDWKGKLVFVAHGATSWTSSWLNRYADFADSLVAVSQLSRSVIRVPDHQVSVIRNGIDLDRIIRPEERVESVPTLGFLGRWSTEKRGHLIAEAAQMIGCRAAFLIPEGKQPDARRDMRKSGSDYDWYTTPQLKEFLSKISCLVVPSQHEGGPLVVAEAWASGVPVACTSVGMIPELEAIHGPLRVPLSNPPTSSELGTILERIDPAVTEKAYRMAREHLTKERMASDYAVLSRRLIPAN